MTVPLFAVTEPAIMPFALISILFPAHCGCAEPKYGLCASRGMGWQLHLSMNGTNNQLKFVQLPIRLLYLIQVRLDLFGGFQAIVNKKTTSLS